MSPDTILDIARESIIIILLVSAPALMASFVVGLIMSFLQAIFQIQEYTFAFVPKLLAIMACLILYAPWMIQKMSTFASGFFGGFLKYIK